MRTRPKAYVGLGKLYADRGALGAGDLRTETSDRARQHPSRAALRAGQTFTCANSVLAAAVPFYETRHRPVAALSPSLFQLGWLTRPAGPDYGPAHRRIAPRSRGPARGSGTDAAIGADSFCPSAIRRRASANSPAWCKRSLYALKHTSLTAQIWMVREDADAARAALQQGLETRPETAPRFWGGWAFCFCRRARMKRPYPFCSGL